MFPILYNILTRWFSNHKFHLLLQLPTSEIIVISGISTKNTIIQNNPQTTFDTTHFALFLLTWLHLCYFFIHVQSFDMCHCGFVKFCWCNLNPKMMDCLGMVSVLAFIFRPTPSTFVTIFSLASCILLKFIHWTSLYRLWYQGVIRTVQINGYPDGSSNSSSMLITTRSPTFNAS